MNNYNSKPGNNFLTNYYEIAGAIIISAVFVLFVAYGFYLFSDPVKSKTITIARSNVPDYSRNFSEIKRRGKVDSLLVTLYSEKEKFSDSVAYLNNKIGDVAVDNSDTETKIKIIASIIAIIIAIVGFFGFKSLNDIRENAIKNSLADAKEIAKKIAEETSKSTLEFFRSKLLELEALIKAIEKEGIKNSDELGKRLDHLRELRDFSLIGEEKKEVKEVIDENEDSTNSSVEDIPVILETKDDTDEEENLFSKEEK